MTESDHTETIANEILTDLSLRDKHIIAHMDENDIMCLSCRFSKYINQKAPGSDSQKRMDIVRAVWSKLCESHRLKVVK
jgi:hypothetical protein